MDPNLSFEIKIVFDNQRFDKDFKSGFGFSALIYSIDFCYLTRGVIVESYFIIKLLSPCHCTRNINEISKRFPEQYQKICVGSSLYF